MTYPYGNGPYDNDRDQQNPGDWNQPGYGDQQHQYGQQHYYGQQPSYGAQQPNMGGFNYNYGNVPPGPKPENYLVWSILTTIFCCIPAGIVSIVFANQVDKYWAQGNYGAAAESSRKAKLWAIISAGASAAVYAVALVFYIFLFAVVGSSMSGYY